ncbi:uncharacterized protein EKO05_0011048 [Ascochyta rabiei]|uniref:uncharacterized protein n=1 Tax=Didymella rabiei TaxID=5454 RepID=UPI0018FF57B2|nr:uncharacterized protein EKO05_0011048 [Ascochyta rabiei]UPX20831.1 hypothetical protein EKO05_0011048 [Ascochyta rabiei]
MNEEAYTTIELLTPNGPEFRRVSTAPARHPHSEEIPLIDFSSIDDDLEARKSIVEQVRKAAENTGFFYIYNHGIQDSLIQSALAQAKAFFEQPLENKAKLLPDCTGPGVGYRGVSSTQINRTESRDRKETFAIQYDQRYDPRHNVSPDITSADEETVRSHDLIWKRTQQLQGFQATTVSFWQERLQLARKLVRIFALALSLPETYFDDVTTTPGADALYIHYPPSPPHASDETIDVGIGSHTDIQLFTLLWQDNSGGLQVLANTDEWLDARPIEGTLVVNVGDFLQRLSNDKFRSTVHRVYNKTEQSRYSMPFCFGFNADAVCEVVPTCVDDERPPKYAPISCGEWRQQRFALATRPSRAH